MWNPLDGLSTVNVGFRKLYSNAKMPTYGSEEAAGADLYAVHGAAVCPLEHRLISTGISIQLPPDSRHRCVHVPAWLSSMGSPSLNSPGTIDSDFRGEIGVIIRNTGKEIFWINPGDRIAQLNPKTCLKHNRNPSIPLLRD